jgi:hypothetical protein
MAREFRASRFRSKRPVPARRHRSKETIVARREHPKPQEREIRVTFEPHRLSPTWMAQAYEQVAPIARRSTTESLAPCPRGSQQSQCSDTPEEPAGRRALQGEEHDVYTAQMSRRQKSLVDQWNSICADSHGLPLHRPLKEGMVNEYY